MRNEEDMMVVATIVKIELITILATGAVVLLLGLVETVKDFMVPKEINTTALDWRDEDDESKDFRL